MPLATKPVATNVRVSQDSRRARIRPIRSNRRASVEEEGHALHLINTCDREKVVSAPPRTCVGQPILSYASVTTTTGRLRCASDRSTHHEDGGHSLENSWMTIDRTDGLPLPIITDFRCRIGVARRWEEAVRTPMILRETDTALLGGCRQVHEQSLYVASALGLEV